MFQTAIDDVRKAKSAKVHHEIGHVLVDMGSVLVHANTTFKRTYGSPTSGDRPSRVAPRTSADISIIDDRDGEQGVGLIIDRRARGHSSDIHVHLFSGFA